MALLLAAFQMPLPLGKTFAAETCNRVVAVVNDDVITLHELYKRVKEVTGMDPENLREQSRRRYEEVNRRILDSLINERIAQERIRQLDIQVTDQEVNDAIQRIRKDNHWSTEELRTMVQAQGMTWEEYQQKIREDIQRQKLINFEVKSRIIIRDEQIEKYYEENKDRFTQEGGVEIATIFLAKNNSNENGSKVREKAEQILQEIRNGGDFEELARRHSDGPGAREGGYIGRFRLQDLDPLIRETVENTPPGGVGDLVAKPNGYQIVKVLSKRGGGVLPLEEVRDAIYNTLLREEIDRRYAAWIRELRENTYTKIFF